MSTVGAYIELRPGQAPPLHADSRWQEGDLLEKTPEGLEVFWGDRGGEVPGNAQVYLAWAPIVYAVWEAPEEEEPREIEGENQEEESV